MTHTFIPEYEITQRVTAIRLPNNHMPVAGTRTDGKTVTIVPVSLRVFDTDGVRRVEGTGPRIRDEDGTLAATWTTVTVGGLLGCPEWVLAVLDGIR